MSYRSILYAAAKDLLDPGRHYRTYTLDDLLEVLAVAERPIPAPPPPTPRGPRKQPARAPQPQPGPEPEEPQRAAQADPGRSAPRASAPDPRELPGQRLNTKAEDEPIRVDAQGRVWFQEEVLKPAYAKPRGRRVLKYMDTGTETRTVQNGEYVETFEIAGEGEARPAEVKITLPSYQVGIYKDPRFPFKVHTYNGRTGFDLYEVQQYWGGPEMVPTTVKRVYVENDLCYDIRSVVSTIQAEHRQLVLTGRI